MPVRIAKLEDLNRLVALGRDMHRESNFSNFLLNIDKFKKYLIAGISRDDLFLGVYETKNQIEGYIFGTLSAPFFSDELVAADLMFYVSPSCRGGPGAFRLWILFRDWAKLSGAAEIRQGITTGIDPNKANRFFQKLGMEFTGQNYRLDLRNRI